MAKIKLCLQFWWEVPRKIYRITAKLLKSNKKWKLGAAVRITRTALLSSVPVHVNKFDVQHLILTYWKNRRKQRKSDKISSTYLIYNLALKLDSNTAYCSNDPFIKRQAETAVSEDLCWPLVSLGKLYLRERK